MRIYEITQADIKPYANLNDKYPVGNTEVWFARDNMSTPDANNLRATHILVGRISETEPKNVFAMMQGEIFSPQGEAEEFMRRVGLSRSNMQPGDIIKTGNDILLVTKDGFDSVVKSNKEPTSEANYFKADKTFRQKRLPTLEPDPVDSADAFDIRKHDQSTDDGPDIDMTNAQVRAQVTQILSKLPPRMERMLRERFFQGLTLDQIGEKYSISRERIRQIEAKALRMLKHPSRARILRPLLNNSAEIN